ncbi:MAG: glutamyl-tRNA reductase [Corynebacterium sp.]|nr:glutamyl-tRNA reductase [Corynebacterium sp.]
MSILVVGMSHRCAPVDMLERVSMDDATRIQATQELIAGESIEEAMIISTCNRVEVYAVASGFHNGVNEVIDVIGRVSGVPAADLRANLYVRYADAAAEHLLLVTAGLDSMVVGEQQIIGQVRTAYQLAQEAGTVGQTLHAIAQSALRAGKRVHTETEIDETGPSMVSFALDQALKQNEWADMRGRTALVMGAGVMASMAATYLGKAGVDELIIANRTRARAEVLAEHAREAGVAARAIDFDDRASVYGTVDMVVSATGADCRIVKAQDIPPRCPTGRQKLVLVDLSLPRDIEDACAEIPGVSLVNIERLHELSAHQNQGPTAAAEAIVAEELAAYSSAERVKDIAPSVAALRAQANQIMGDEFKRLMARTPGLEENERAEVERAMKRLVDKILHQPTVRAKELAADSATVSYESALQQLFGLPAEVLPEHPAASISAQELPLEVPHLQVIADR